MTPLVASDRMLLERCVRDCVCFRYSTTPGSDALKLVGSSISVSQRKHLHRLALDGLLSETDGGLLVTFKITAAGREALGLRQETKPVVHFQRAKTAREMLLESRGD